MNGHAKILMQNHDGAFFRSLPIDIQVKVCVKTDNEELLKLIIIHSSLSLIMLPNPFQHTLSI